MTSKTNSRRSAKEPAVESVRICPDCEGDNDASANVCEHCGYRFPKARGKRKPTTRHNLASVTVRLHSKRGKPDSMRITYGLAGGAGDAEEWVCFQHDANAKEWARDWWRQHGGQSPAPVTTLEAMQRIDGGELSWPVGFGTAVKPGGRRIVHREFEQEDWASWPSTAPTHATVGLPAALRDDDEGDDW